MSTLTRFLRPPSRLLAACALLAAFLVWPVQAQDDAFRLENGALARLQNDATLDLGGNTRLIEDESSGARLTGGTGQVRVVRSLDAPSSQNVGGLGAVLSSDQNLGETTVLRGHAVQTGGTSNESIERYYDIMPTNDSGLDATFEFNYRDAETNALDESNLVFFRSEDGGESYQWQGADSRDLTANTVTLNNIDSLSRWTLASSSQPIPVEQGPLEARQDGEQAAVLLTWRTFSETNNDGFEVQHHPGGAKAEGTGVVQWKTVDFVESQALGGNSTESINYRYRVEDLDYGEHTFRLVQVDGDGARTPGRVQTVEVRMQGAFALSDVYPNPVRSGGQATMDVTVRETQQVTVALYDARGRRVRVLHDGSLEGQSTEQVTVGGSGLASGVYFVRVRGGDFAEARRFVLVQ